MLLEGGKIAELQRRSGAALRGMRQHRGAVVETMRNKAVLLHVEQVLAGAAGKIQILVAAALGEGSKHATRETALGGIIDLGTELVVIPG
jgi:hypothetical protein